VDERSEVMEETRIVQGQELEAIGRMSGRPMYAFTADGVRYRLTPDTAATWVLRREGGAYCGLFASIEEAVRYAADAKEDE
jgi:hypothetical protein